MTQRIINSIIKSIKSVYPDARILDDEIEQSVKRPAFYIRCYHSLITDRILPAGFFKKYCFEITYEPGKQDPDRMCREVEDNLTPVLRRIEDVDSQYAFRPINFEFKTVDGYLQILFDIIVELKEIREPDPSINEYSIKSGVFK